MSYAYDLLGRMTSATGVGKTIAYGNDLRGLRTSLTLDDTKVAYAYDDAGRLGSVQKTGEAAAAVYGYDDGGRRESLALPNGVSTSYAYDGEDRLLSLRTTGPGGTLASFTYSLDPTGNRDSITYADGSSSSYDYDDAYRLTGEVRTKAGGGTAYEITYQYDDVGNRIRMTSTNARPYAADHSDEDGGATCLFHLDEPEGSLQVADSSGSALLGDVCGGVTLARPGRFSTAAGFDGSSGAEIAVPDAEELEVADKPFTLEAWIKPDALVSGVPSAVLSKWREVEGPESPAAMSYLLMVNAEGKLEGRVWDPGTEAAVVVLSDEPLPVPETGEEGPWIHVALERSSTGELALYVDDAKQTDVADADFALADTGESFRIGAAGNVEEGEAADGMYFVGAIDEVRLSVMTPGTPARGEAGSLGRVIVNYVYNARNQLVTETSGASEKIYCYDPNGNVRFITEMVGGLEASVEEMTYDELNRMLTHTGPTGTETFTYRGAEWHRASANGTQFLYDGDDVLADIGAGGVEAMYVTPFLDQNLSITKVGSTYYYSQDGLGSVRTLTDATGTVVNRYDYLAFGGAHAPGTNATVEQRYTYTGREASQTASVYHLRFRLYRPSLGRFLGRDPALVMNPTLAVGRGSGTRGCTGILPRDSGPGEAEIALKRPGYGIYSYARSRPTTHVDRYGLHSVGFWHNLCHELGRCDDTHGGETEPYGEVAYEAIFRGHENMSLVCGLIHGGANVNLTKCACGIAQLADIPASGGVNLPKKSALGKLVRAIEAVDCVCSALSSLDTACTKGLTAQSIASITTTAADCASDYFGNLVDLSLGGTGKADWFVQVLTEIGIGSIGNSLSQTGTPGQWLPQDQFCACKKVVLEGKGSQFGF